MRDVGIDLGDATPHRLTTELAERVNLLVTMGCGDACPFVSGLERTDWNLPDPRGQLPDRVRAIRDEIRERVRDLIARREWARE